MHIIFHIIAGVLEKMRICYIANLTYDSNILYYIIVVFQGQPDRFYVKNTSIGNT